MDTTRFRFVFSSRADYELAIRALDWMRTSQQADAQNDQLRADQREESRERAAQANRVALELRNLAEELHAPCRFCLDRPGHDGLGRTCKHCGGSGRASC